MGTFGNETLLRRRIGVAVAATGIALLLAACAGPVRSGSQSGKQSYYRVDPAVVAMYAPVESEPHRIPAIPVRQIDPKYFRQQVPTPSHVTEAPGTIVVDPANNFLYLVEDGGRSMRYGIGVGRAGFSWNGKAVIKDKQHWPKWFPPAEMVARDPTAAPYAKGMEGGLDNPLGARALYLYQGDKDTLYRLHGTNQPMSIGGAMSSGCIRLFNQDIIDLYERIPLGTTVVVLNAPESLPAADSTYPAIAVGPSVPARTSTETTRGGTIPVSAPAPVTATPLEPLPGEPAPII